MPITNGSLSGRIWRVTEPLPPQFTDVFARNLKRFAFRPLDPQKGVPEEFGWVNVRQPLDSELTLNKAQFRNIIALALRVDRVSLNMRLFKAKLAQEIEQVVKSKPTREKLSDEQRAVIEEKIKVELLKNQTPSMSIYEMAWNMESGLVIFSASSERINAMFAELFSQTFNLSLEPQAPWFRAAKWAARQRADRALREALPSPFSPKAPAQIVDATALASGDE